MTNSTADIVICGAGIAGISTDYHVIVKHGMKSVLRIDEHTPLSVTSDKSTECYRNWWPGPGNAMVSFMNRSIDILEEVATMIPGMEAYFGRIPKPLVDGGYYTKTRENRPLTGPLPVEGAYVIGALSGLGIMAACASGDLLAAHLTGSGLPHYAPAFRLEGYEDREYQKLLENWRESGQL